MCLLTRAIWYNDATERNTRPGGYELSLKMLTLSTPLLYCILPIFGLACALSDVSFQNAVCIKIYLRLLLCNKNGHIVSYNVE